MTNDELELTKIMITQAYKDVASPIAKQIGSTLEEVAKFILSPVYYPTKLLNTRIKSWFERISNEIDKEDLIEAQPNISIPTMKALALYQDNTLIGEMFFNILKSSVNRKKKIFNSPAFPKILEQLTRDECLFLVLLNKRNYKIHQEADFDEKKGIFSNKREILNELPIEKFDYPENFWLYNNHLNHLNLAGCWEYKKQEPILDTEEIKQTNGATTVKRQKQIGVKIFLEFQLNDFGKMFCNVCISDKCYEYI